MLPSPSSICHQQLSTLTCKIFIELVCILWNVNIYQEIRLFYRDAFNVLSFLANIRLLDFKENSEVIKSLKKYQFKKQQIITWMEVMWKSSLEDKQRIKQRQRAMELWSMARSSVVTKSYQCPYHSYRNVTNNCGPV